MILKIYQQNTLDILRKFFETCRITGAEEAYRTITKDPNTAARLGFLRGDYECWKSIQNTPRICLKVPTGGGKTIIAAHAIKIIADTWLEKENPVVLWFTPSDTIRKQTSEALKNARHPYRIALDEQFNEKVRIFDLDEKFNIRPADIENGICIVVSTVQAFRQSNTDKYKVYAHHEDLEPHFSHIPKIDGMELNDNGEIKYSFTNLLHYHRPIIIVDEAHNVITNLSQEMQGRINPSAIVELTATPRPNNNTLYNVRAMELKEEEMIKLPIELREHSGWEQAVDEAILKRTELEKIADDEADYIRPILLFQAQDKNGDVNVDALKDYLINTANIPATEIAIATGEQKELDGINVFARDCQIRYVITVEALKEGWDCSFAYVLCSLANIQSNTAVEQLLGRIMRMPYAKMRKAASLNKAYAYVLSKTFGEATGALIKKLSDKGFDETEAALAMETKPSELGGLFKMDYIDKVDLEKPIPATELPKTIKIENEGKTIVFTPETTKEDIEQLSELVPEKTVEFETKFFNYKFHRQTDLQSPAQRGEKFTVPRLMVELQGEFEFAEPDRIFEAFDWNIAKFASPRMDANEFNIEPQGHGFVIDIDGNKLTCSPSGVEQLSLPLRENTENWTLTNLVLWLDKNLHQDDIPQPQMLEWLRQAIEHLTDTRGIKLSTLILAKYPMKNKIETKITTAREKAQNEAFQTTLFAREERVKLNFDNSFEFHADMYDGSMMYNGYYKFKRHFLGANKVPAIDGGDTGEEFACAKEIDRLEQVEILATQCRSASKIFPIANQHRQFLSRFCGKIERRSYFSCRIQGQTHN